MTDREQLILNDKGLGRLLDPPYPKAGEESVQGMIIRLWNAVEDTDDPKVELELILRPVQRLSQGLPLPKNNEELMPVSDVEPLVKALRYITGQDVAGMEGHQRPADVASAALGEFEGDQ